MKRIAIVGGGPIGLEAALAAIERGYAAEVFERGLVADAVRQWGHVRMFSPFSMNATARGRVRLKHSGIELPKPDELLTGAQFRERYLAPLARSFPAGAIHENCAVLAIGRSRVLKGDHIGAISRGETAFRLLVCEDDRERAVTADVVLDCSGTYGQPNQLGDGGIPLPNERLYLEQIHYGIPEFSGAMRARYDGKRVLVVGAGHSAATVICNLAALDPATKIHWLMRRDRELPSEEIPDDPLPERARLAAAANRFARDHRVILHRAASIAALESHQAALRVEIVGSTGSATVEVDEIIVATGFRPDLSLTRELQVQTCWATEGTYPLAASLLGEASADCLKTPAFGAEMLIHPEPGYFTLGMKSYGRSPNFLLRTGHEQIETVFDWMDKQSLGESAKAEAA
ncbi:MAG: NAD(P)-binding domain-containing protein [Verrucomicrobiota bacterium]